MVKYGNEELIMGIQRKSLHIVAINFGMKSAVGGANYKSYIWANSQNNKQWVLLYCKRPLALCIILALTFVDL
jgi:hypothetical protein